MSTKTFRGRTVDELLPQIREELGPDAVITKQREGLTGGMGGFFQRKCVEVEARGGTAATIDTYDDAPLSEGPATIDDFAELLAQHTQAQPEPEPEPEPEPQFVPDPLPENAERRGVRPMGGTERRSPLPERNEEAEEVERELVERGLNERLASLVVDAVVVHKLPFGGHLRALVRDALARRIPIATPESNTGVVTFVGPGGVGKTTAVAALASAYASTGALPVTVVSLRAPDGGGELRRLLAPLGVPLLTAATASEAAGLVTEVRGRSLVIVDTPGVHLGREDDVRRLAAELEAIDADAVHLAVPVTLSGPALEKLTTTLAPLRPDALALTRVDETDHVGLAVSHAIEAGVPVSWTSNGTVKPADADDLAERLLP